MDDENARKGVHRWVKIDDPCVRKLIHSYLERRQQDLIKMRAALAAQDYDYFRTLGHNLSGSGTAYGLDDISEIGNALFDAANTKDEAVILIQIDTLQAYIRSVEVI